MKDVFKLAGLLLGVAAFGMMINRSSDTVSLFKGASDAYSGLLRTATFQNNNGF